MPSLEATAVLLSVQELVTYCKELSQEKQCGLVDGAPD